VTSLRLYPEGSTLDERLQTLGQALDLVRHLDDDQLRPDRAVSAPGSGGSGKGGK
jgi:hypothetical protein